HAAADGHVSQLGLAERLAQADPRGQPALHEPGARGRARHRGRRLGMDHEPRRPGEGAGEAHGGREPRHRVDVERHRQALRRVGARSGRARVDPRLPAQSPDRRSAAAAARRPPLLQQRSRHWPGRLVRPQGAHREGRCPRASGNLAALRGALSSLSPLAGRGRPCAAWEALMTGLPATTAKKLGLVIDLDTCVGCQACATSCKEWNTGGYSAPLSDHEPYGADPHGAWLNRVHGYEVGEGAAGRTVHFPRSCLHCEEPACVTVCPTGASFKRAEDGIVLVNPDTCIGCKLCSWACPYGAREYDYSHGVMKKCTLCVDRIYNDHLPEEDRIPACVRACPTGARHFGDLGDPGSAVSRLVAERGGYDLLPELGYKPVNKYLPPRPRRDAHAGPAASASLHGDDSPTSGSTADRLFAWVDRVLSR